MVLIDTNVAIGLRDGDPGVRERVAGLETLPVISVITRIELENGANREPAIANMRKRLLDRFLQTIAIEYFTPADILAYGRIVYDLGHDRRLTLDRLIAAQALARDIRLITMNGKDFHDIEGLRLEVWESRAAGN